MSLATTHAESSAHRGWVSRSFQGCVLALVMAGCTTVYHPMSGFHRPVVVSTGAQNFKNTQLTIQCRPGGLLSPSEASKLCNNISLLFENQGSKVKVVTGAGRFGDTFGDIIDEEPPDLVLTLSARQTHSDKHLFSWVAFAFTLTLAPGVTEESFAQDITIHDGDGFLLVTDKLEGRLVHRMGAGTWVAQQATNLLQEKKDRVTTETAKADLSSDLYRQLSQLMFNAKVHREVMEHAANPGLKAGVR